VDDQASRDAEYIHSACVGLGTNDEKLIEIMVTRGARERTNIATQYAAKYGKTLSDEIKSETSFNYKQALEALGWLFFFSFLFFSFLFFSFLFFSFLFFSFLFFSLFFCTNLIFLKFFFSKQPSQDQL
jgi:hypothetical protein